MFTEAIRSFNRFYTRKLGVLREGLLDSPFSLTEARVLYELAHCEAPSASPLAAALALDAGYLSRILRGFRSAGLVERSAAREDARRGILKLTRKGRGAVATLEAASRRQIAGMIEPLAETETTRLLAAMQTIQAVLEGGERTVTIRNHRPGDLGLIVQRHAVLYAREWNWNGEFEGLVAEIAAKFIRTHRPDREACWIAETDGEFTGCVMLVKKSAATAQLRLLLVEPHARGLGIGARLVGECVEFARRAGYRKIRLWTNSVLTAARAIYEKKGFRLLREEPHKSFGQDLLGQIWELNL